VKEERNRRTNQTVIVTCRKIAQEFQCPINYQSKLPPPPFDPKLLEPPLPEDTHYKEALSNTVITSSLDLYGKDANNGVPVAPLSLGFIWQIGKAFCSYPCIHSFL
jgi:hypothetical protein